jgi:hypothetical protein
MTWTSSDESVAIVKDGIVTTLKAGNATITATSATGAFASVEISCKGTASSTGIPLSGLQLNETSVTLERLADEINNGDLIEDFVQGAQKLRRESPALRAYNTTIKSFSALTNQLVALLPEKEKKSAGDELMSFITKPAARSGK